MKIGTKSFDMENKTYVMGILNATPDSFSDGGAYHGRMDVLLARAEQMVREGADLIDIGGESTRPGCGPVPEEEEMQRVLPVIEAVRREFDIPISLDTYKSNVALEGIKAGAVLINDVSGLQYDGGMAGVIAANAVSCCLMHSRKEPDYQAFKSEIKNDIGQMLQLAEKAGIAHDHIILDPGIGFGKTHQQNLELLNSLEEFRVWGYPLLLGASRKSVIGLTLGLPVQERLEGTLVTTVMAVMHKCAFVRVHDIKENVRAIQMTEAILHAGRGVF